MLPSLFQRPAARSASNKGDSRCTEVLSIGKTQRMDTAREKSIICFLHRQRNHEAVSLQS